jgi:hypothetical protein
MRADLQFGWAQALFLWVVSALWRMGGGEGEKKLVWLIVSLFQYAQVIRGFRLVGVEHRMLWGNVEEYRSRLKANGLQYIIR